MPAIMLDMIILILTLGIIYALTSEGLWGAALMFFNCLFSALISFNFYEPVASLIADSVGAESFLTPYADMLSMMILFIVPLFLLRLTTESLAPSMIRFPTPVYHLGRLIFATGGSVVTMGMIMLAFDAAPVQKKLVGVMDFAYQPFFKARFDRDFLAFFQYTSGYTFARNGVGSTGDSEFPGKPMLFDPRAEWLLFHQKARPYGTESILKEDPADPTATPAATPGATPGGQSGPGGQGGPGGQNRPGGRPGPGVAPGPGGNPG